jgi:hypothetical protein
MTGVQAVEPPLHDLVRQAVRTTLQSSALYQAAPADARRELARKLVNVATIAAKLLDEDRRLTEQVARRRAARAVPLALAQSAGDQLGMQATRAAAGTIAAVRDSINFPVFVQSLITGVFQAILSSSVQQLGSIGEMLDGVSATADEFQGTVGDAEVGPWLTGKFPSLFVAGEGGVTTRPEVDLSEQGPALQAGLGATEDEVSGIDGDDLPGTLLPLARRKMARDKQSLLATMVQMGLQRIVVDEGRIHASMDLRVDAQSGSTEQRTQRDDWRVNAAAAASGSFGPWSASASASTSVGQVKTDQQYTDEQIAVRAGLRSSVDLAFRTEQVPLDRMASEHARVRIDANARVPADVSGGQGIVTAPPAFTPISIGDIPAPPTPPTPPTAPGTQPATTQPRTGTTPPRTGTAPPRTGTTPPGTTPPRTGTTPPGTTQPRTGTAPPASSQPRTATTAPRTGTTPPRTAPPRTGTTPPGSGTTAPPGSTSPTPAATEPGAGGT